MSAIANSVFVDGKFVSTFRPWLVPPTGKPNHTPPPRHERHAGHLAGVPLGLAHHCPGLPWFRLATANSCWCVAICSARVLTLGNPINPILVKQAELWGAINQDKTPATFPSTLEHPMLLVANMNVSFDSGMVRCLAVLKATNGHLGQSGTISCPTSSRYGPTRPATPAPRSSIQWVRSLLPGASCSHCYLDKRMCC